MVIIITMAKRKPKTMTELLREALHEADSIRGVAKATGLQHASLIRFLDGRQSIRLDMADRLAKYFNLHTQKGEPDV